MKKNYFIFVCLLALTVFFPSNVIQADTGPKPSVVITLDNFSQSTYYVTLLSNTDSTGPHNEYDALSDNAKYSEGDEDYEIWKKFLNYKDTDGYHFLQYFTECSDTNRFTWGYYPPDKFKILIYFPDSDMFAVSTETYERYAFDSYYVVDGSSIDYSDSNGEEVIQIPAAMIARDFNYTSELDSLAVRICVTIFIEIMIALLFRIRERKALLLITITNIVTQVGLNLILNPIKTNPATFSYRIEYIFLELLIFIFEAIVYTLFLPKVLKKNSLKNYQIIAYAFVANLLSFGAGIILANWIPEIF